MKKLISLALVVILMATILVPVALAAHVPGCNSTQWMYADCSSHTAQYTSMHTVSGGSCSVTSWSASGRIICRICGGNLGSGRHGCYEQHSICLTYYYPGH
jgi:hypothetical protein